MKLTACGPGGGGVCSPVWLVLLDLFVPAWSFCGGVGGMGVGLCPIVLRDRFPVHDGTFPRTTCIVGKFTSVLELHAIGCNCNSVFTPQI